MTDGAGAIAGIILAGVGAACGVVGAGGYFAGRSLAEADVIALRTTQEQRVVMDYTYATQPSETISLFNQDLSRQFNAVKAQKERGGSSVASLKLPVIKSLLQTPQVETTYNVTFFDSVDEQSFKPGWSTLLAAPNLKNVAIPETAKRFFISENVKTTRGNSWSEYSSVIVGAYVVVDSLPSDEEVKKITDYLKKHAYQHVDFIDRNKNTLLSVDLNNNVSAGPQKPAAPPSGP